jgi:hypothetical protein
MNGPVFPAKSTDSSGLKRIAYEDQPSKYNILKHKTYCIV